MESTAAIILPSPGIKYSMEKKEGGVVLKKDGTPKKIVINNKKKGMSSEVEALTFEDAKKLLDYFKIHEKWPHYLAFTFSCNMARRAGDTLRFQWKHLFNPETGELRKHILPFQEKKTDKYASPYINDACVEAIKLYLDSTLIDPALNNFENPVFIQTTGNNIGGVLTLDGHLKALKKAAKEVGIPYNIGTHSGRKTFGKLSRMLHPNDYDSMEILRMMYNHNDTKTTGRYIGITKERLDKYNDDMGKTWLSCVVGDDELNLPSDAPVVTVETKDLRELLKTAYKLGIEDNDAKHRTGEDNPTASMDAMDTLMEMLEAIRK